MARVFTSLFEGKVQQRSQDEAQRPEKPKHQPAKLRGKQYKKGFGHQQDDQVGLRIHQPQLIAEQKPVQQHEKAVEIHRRTERDSADQHHRPSPAQQHGSGKRARRQPAVPIQRTGCQHKRGYRNHQDQAQSPQRLKEPAHIG